jgi:hypothetical protein
VARRSWATLFVALLRAKPDPRYCGGHALAGSGQVVAAPLSGLEDAERGWAVRVVSG